ncbi:MAG: class B sortase [Bacilli bacterium]|nr:class B sortase [Bacilli bacterium]
MKNKAYIIKKVILGILLIFFLFLFIYSGYKIIRWKIDSNKTKKEIKEIHKKVKIDEIEDNENTIIIEQPEEIPAADPYWDFIKVNLIDVDFTKLLNTNPNTKGWIQIAGTNINYPFVQTTDNNFYLFHSFDNSYNEAGWVFMDYRNNVENFDRNTIIYAHGRYDNTMFGTLKNVFQNNWLDNQANYIVKLSTPYENTLWQVFSVYRIKTTDDYIQVYFNDDDEYQKFLNMIIGRSMHNFNTTVNANDNILTLSTCYNESDKVVLHAKLIKKEVK